MIFEKLNIVSKNKKKLLPSHRQAFSQNNGFILHSKEYKKRYYKNFTISKPYLYYKKIIEDIAKNIGPKKYFISLGYAGWGKFGQLEEEIINNSWIKIKEELDLIFDVEAEKKVG